MAQNAPPPSRRGSCLKALYVRLLLVLVAGFAVFILIPAGRRAFFPRWAATAESASGFETQIAVSEDDLPLATIYFTDPYGEADINPDQAVIHAIDAARERIEIAMYNFNLENITDALLRAQQRGVRVQMVLDNNAINHTQTQRLIDGGIAVRSDGRPESMHNKFIVIDQDEVWTGSLNLTFGGTYNDHNNIVRMVDYRINQNYHAEFIEMFDGGFFGAGSPQNTPFPQIVLDGTLVEVYFSPEDGALDQIIDVVENAQESVEFLAFSFTSDPLADAMLERSSRGIRVRGVFDADQIVSNTGGEFERLKGAGLDVRWDTLSGLMHHKVIIVDSQVVVFGSYNFSNNAENINDENLVIYYDPEFAVPFIDEFNRIYTRSQP